MMCQVDGCGRGSYGLTGLCNMHYQRKRKTGDVGSALPRYTHRAQSVECQVDGCESLSVKKGFCNRHYLRQYRFGSTDYPGRKGKDKILEALPVRTCRLCERTQGPEAYSDYTWAHSKHKAVCRECDTLRAFASKHGIPLDDVTLFFRTQPRQCQICGTEEDLVLDHCHARNDLRGFLCRSHNLLLGLAGDSAEVLESAIKYLARFD